MENHNKNEFITKENSIEIQPSTYQPQQNLMEEGKFLIHILHNSQRNLCYKLLQFGQNVTLQFKFDTELKIFF